MAGLLDLVGGVVVFSPEREAEARADGPRVAFHPRPYERLDSIFADAYASCQQTLDAAIAYAAKEDRVARRTGPLRIVYVGPLGEDRARAPIGHLAIVTNRILIGRSDTCEICLRQGPHSDQNTSARAHATIARTERGTLLVSDLESTNGTWVRGLRVTRPTEVVPGDEITIAFGHRLRVDGL